MVVLNIKTYDKHVAIFPVYSKMGDVINFQNFAENNIFFQL